MQDNKNIHSRTGKKTPPYDDFEKIVHDGRFQTLYCVQFSIIHGPIYAVRSPMRFISFTAERSLFLLDNRLDVLI